MKSRVELKDEKGYVAMHGAGLKSKYRAAPPDAKGRAGKKAK